MLMAMMLSTVVSFVQTNVADPKIGKHLVWQDEFKGSGLPDPSKWQFECGFVRNHEAQRYTNGRVSNAHVEHGVLTIEGRHEKFEGGEYTSADLASKVAWDHGYFEFVAKIPTGRGTWPAIWFLGDGIRKKGADYIGWPLCGEIDLMENVGFDPDKIHFNIHTQSKSQAPGSESSSHVEVQNASTQWHTYGLDYQSHKLELYFDGKKVLTYLDDGKGNASWPFAKPQFIILNLAIGGDWGGQKGIDNSIFPVEFKIKSVKVYQ